MSEFISSPDHAALIIKKLLDWYARIFHAHLSGRDSIKPPYILLDWLQNNANADTDQKAFYEDLGDAVEALIDKAQSFLTLDKGNSEDVQAAHQELSMLLEEICDRIIQQISGNDDDDESLIIRSGLNAYPQLVKDFAVELERRSRHGSTFAFGLVAIKSYEDDKVKGRSTQDFFATAAAIKKCMRVFDEAYVLSDVEFAVLLKETDNNGGIRFYKRLEEVVSLSTSKVLFCASEPVPGDDVQVLLKQMRREIENLDVDDPSSVIHTEVSPLELFLRDHDHDDE